MEYNIMVDGTYISEIYTWFLGGLLNVNRRYQRKLVWTLKEKQDFIDTVMRGYPVPLFLLVNTKQKVNGLELEQKEIIDGLQRLEAIISFIMNKYPIEINGVKQYFNIEAYPGSALLVNEDKLKQKYPAIPLETCSKFLLYQLPISLINADDAVVDEVFKRINSTGRKLSAQDLRQAGSVGKFGDLVYLLATQIRGDATADIVSMNEIADYSLSSAGLHYGLDVNKVFWVEQGIISEDALRRSKDEEIIAILCNCLLSNYTRGMSVRTLDSLYNPTSAVYNEYEKLLTESKTQDIINIFRLVIRDLENTFSVTDTTFNKLLFKPGKNYNKDLVFIIIFLALSKLYAEHYVIKDYKKMSTALDHIANNELNDIIVKSECVWNTDVRNHLIDRVKNILVKYMEFQEDNPLWNEAFKEFLKQVSVEGQLLDFKIGIHDLRTGKENDDVICKIVKTLTAMVNTHPMKEGVVIIGISDKERDAADFATHYKTTVTKYNDLYVTGVVHEASKYYGSIQAYTKHLKDVIEKQNVAPEVIQYLLENMDTLKYEKQTLIVLKLKSNKPLFHDKEMFVRYESHNKPVEAGSSEFYEVLRKFGINV